VNEVSCGETAACVVQFGEARRFHARTEISIRNFAFSPAFPALSAVQSRMTEFRWTAFCSFVTAGNAVNAESTKLEMRFPEIRHEP
jgi:hypothetical protein